MLHIHFWKIFLSTLEHFLAQDAVRSRYRNIMFLYRFKSFGLPTSEEIIPHILHFSMLHERHKFSGKVGESL